MHIFKWQAEYRWKQWRERKTTGRRGRRTKRDGVFRSKFLKMKNHTSYLTQESARQCERKYWKYATSI